VPTRKAVAAFERQQGRTHNATVGIPRLAHEMVGIQGFRLAGIKANLTERLELLRAVQRGRGIRATLVSRRRHGKYSQFS
jgi:hypothetical protein